MTLVTLAPGVAVNISRGFSDDYNQLARFHYRAGRPSIPWLVLVARRAGASRRSPPVGVLVASFPPINGWWRKLAWPGRFLPTAGGGKRLNREIRIISRVIVDPRWRGLGLARTLVKHYLARHATAKTEAVAAMGDLSPFFARAGMRELRRGPERAAVALASRLASRGVIVDRLVEREYAAAVARDRQAMRAVRAWTREHSSLHRRARAPAIELLAALASRALEGSIAYVTERRRDAQGFKTGGRGKWRREKASRATRPRLMRQSSRGPRQTRSSSRGCGKYARSTCHARR